MAAPKITDAKKLVAIKGFEIIPVTVDSSLGAIITISINPELPLGLKIAVENNAAILFGTPTEISAATHYTITAKNNDGDSSALIEIVVIEAPIKKQRGDVIQAHDARQDLDTPRSQIENAMSDDAMLGSIIKPHEN